MQEESSSVENTPAQNTVVENEVAPIAGAATDESTGTQQADAPVGEKNDVKKENKKTAKKKGPKIPTVKEIVQKETGDAPVAEVAKDEAVSEVGASTTESPAQKSVASAEVASKEAAATPEAALAEEKSEYPDEDTAEAEATARARANLNLDSETALLETILFLESEPQNTENLAKISQLSIDVVNEALARLREKYANADSGIEIAEIIGGWMLVPKKESFDLVKEKYGKKNEGRLSKAAIETLSIIAYSQPITRAEIESIRHVNADNMMRILLDRNFIKEVGKKDIPGKPILYGTTKEFLEFFHLQSIADLPQLDEKESERFELAR